LDRFVIRVYKWVAPDTVSTVIQPLASRANGALNCTSNRQLFCRQNLQIYPLAGHAPVWAGRPSLLHNDHIVHINELNAFALIIMPQQSAKKRSLFAKHSSSASLALVIADKSRSESNGSKMIERTSVSRVAIEIRLAETIF
jgi:hypothetical protein